MEADVVITYDAVACQVWLDPLDHAPDGGQPLCSAHALRLSPPRGWVVMDRRREQSELVSGLPRSTETTGAPARTRAPKTSNRRSGRRGQALARRWGEFSEPQLVFTVDPAVAELVEDRLDGTLVPGPEIGDEPEASIEAELEPQVAPHIDSQPEFDSEPEPEPTSVTPALAPEPPSPAPPIPEPPRPTRTRPASTGRPTGRLLGRAFDLTGDQRSALTAIVGSDAESDESAAPADPEVSDESAEDGVPTNEAPVD